MTINELQELNLNLILYLGTILLAYVCIKMIIAHIILIHHLFFNGNYSGKTMFRVFTYTAFTCVIIWFFKRLFQKIKEEKDKSVEEIDNDNFGNNYFDWD